MHGFCWEREGSVVVELSRQANTMIQLLSVAETHRGLLFSCYDKDMTSADLRGIFYSMDS